MKFELTLSRKAMILVTVPVIFELAFVATLSALLYQVDAERVREAHSRDLAAHMNTMLRLLLTRSTASFVYHVTDSTRAHTRFHKAAAELELELAILKELSANDAHEHSVIAQCESILLKGDSTYRATRSEFERGDRIAAAKSAVAVEKGLDELSNLIGDFLAEQTGVQKQKKQLQGRYRQLVQIVLYFGVALNVLLALLLAVYFNRGTTRRLDELMQNIVLLGKDKPLNPPIGGNDELTKIDEKFRSMSNDLNEARRKERAIVENALAVICSINATGKFLQVNPASRSLWGRDAADLIGFSLTSIVLEEDVERTARTVERFIQEESQGTFENRIKRKDGSIIDVHWAVQWSTAEHSLFCVAQDVSAQKEIERLKRDFVTMVSHDLKTPLMTIQMVLELLSSDVFGKLNEDGQNRIGMAEDEVERLMRLIKELLDIEKLESGEHDFEIKTTSLTEIINKAIDSVSGLAARDGINLQTKIAGDFMVDCDSDRLIQVIVNLMSNAIKFSPPNGVVKAVVREVDSWAEVRIEDEGRGIPKELQSKIFDRFRQVTRDDSRVKGGSGLGLAICKTIVEQHGSKIGLESEEGKGSTFWFRLPKTIASAANSAD